MYVASHILDMTALADGTAYEMKQMIIFMMLLGGGGCSCEAAL